MSNYHTLVHQLASALQGALVDDLLQYHSTEWIAKAQKALADSAQEQAQPTDREPQKRTLKDVMRDDPMSPEDFGLAGQWAERAKAYCNAMLAEARAAQPQAASVAPALPDWLDISENIALSSIDSPEFANLMGAHAAAPSMDTAWAVLRYADKRMHEIIARRFELAAPIGMPVYQWLSKVAKAESGYIGSAAHHLMNYYEGAESDPPTPTAQPLTDATPTSRKLVTLNAKQLVELLEAARSDDESDLSTEVTLIQHDQPFKSTDGEGMEAGVYFYWTEYPEEGIVHLAGDTPAGEKA